ncbi:ZIP family metal transporter [Candidatus Marinimicrobia bacterium MT.SAG.4]|nr:ZIP family metal transporter [Candidatus Marinimicrobia bacterium MT.SAG.4]
MGVEGASSEKYSLLKLVLSGSVPLMLLAGLVSFIIINGTGLRDYVPAPLEELSFDRIIFSETGIDAEVFNSGPEPLTIAHVQIGWFNRTSYQFTIKPNSTIPRLGKATVHIPYPWIEGEPYEIVLITSTGMAFTHDVEIATMTPKVTWSLMGNFAMLGVYVGVIPVFLGLLWIYFLRRIDRSWNDFFMALTLGLLVFLGGDALAEAIELSAQVADVLNGTGIIIIGISMTMLILTAIDKTVSKHRARKNEESKENAISLETKSVLTLAYIIAFSIGIHNLGEGLAIGGAYAIGEVSLGTFLVLGFMIHNITEGVAIVAPLSRSKFSLWHLVLLGLLAGAPTIIGTWIGGFIFSRVWSLLLISIGAGAIFQVVLLIYRQMRLSSIRSNINTIVTYRNVVGFMSGLAVMYATGLFVTA